MIFVNQKQRKNRRNCQVQASSYNPSNTKQITLLEVNHFISQREINECIILRYSTLILRIFIIFLQHEELSSSISHTSTKLILHLHTK